MPVVVVANPKGGVGKTTVATNIAGYFASRGHPVMLGDADRQQSSRLWLHLRPPAARPIASWDVDKDQLANVRPRARRTSCSTRRRPARQAVQGNVLKIADKVVVPLSPSIFDIFATRTFLDQLAATRRQDAGRHCRHARGFSRTIAADKLRSFVEGLGLPVLGYLRDDAKLHPPGGPRPDAVRRGAQQGRKRHGAVEGHLPVAGPLRRGFRAGASR
jgi:chromosome partitioning protein